LGREPSAKAIEAKLKRIHARTAQRGCRRRILASCELIIVPESTVALLRTRGNDSV
jgi:hypothetical protein